MSEDIMYCKKQNCTITKCIRNPKNIELHNIPHSFAHLEDNPMYCKKVNWHGNRVKKEDEE